MKTTRAILYLSTLFLFLAACGQAPAQTTFTTVSEGTIKPGDQIPAPTGEVILTVTGDISQKNSDASLKLDKQGLEAIGLVEYDVNDPFVKKNIRYTGVLLSQILKVAGASPAASTLTLTALDDYSVDMKISDVLKYPFLVALKADGEYMPIDKNGPLINIIPYDDFPELDHLTYDAMWVWSLHSIEVK